MFRSGCVSGRTYTLKINGTVGGVAFSEITVSEGFLGPFDTALPLIVLYSEWS